MSKNLLVTGAAGFIGSNLIEYLVHNTDYNIVCYDALTYAASRDNIIENTRVIFIRGNILEKNYLFKIFRRHNITDVIHLAAETHVDNSISNPDLFYKTNVLGTQALIEEARRYWTEEDCLSTSRFHHVSTDEVYGSLKENEFFTEKSNYAPNSPYSASKAASDFVVRSYHKTHNMNVIITNCSNNFGDNQHEEKLIPNVIKKALNNQNIEIYGTGSNERDWLYVKAHCEAILLTFTKGISGETYLIGTNNVLTNNQLVQKICALLDIIEPKDEKYSNQVVYIKNRKGHDERYAIDSSKIKELGWNNSYDFDDCLEKTVYNYVNKFKG